MSIFKCLGCLFLSVSLGGCTYQYIAQSTDRAMTVAELKAHYHLVRFRNIAVQPANTVCVAPVAVEDVEFQQHLNQTLFSALQSRFINVAALANAESQTGALRASWSQGCELLFYPLVIDREDNIWAAAEWGQSETEWSDIGVDKLQLGFAVWDVNASQVLDRAVVTSRAAWLDLYSSTSMDLIEDSINQYLQQLVAVR